MNTQLNQNELLKKIIHERLGLCIHSHQLHDLNKTVLLAAKKFHCTPEDYMQQLLTCSPSSPLLEHLIFNITIGETYFFRDQHQMELLQNTLLPTLIAKKRRQGNLSLRIWSAGCATGEEIYTIAILLRELLPDFKKWTLRLLATDINSASLKKAIKGFYSKWSMRTIPKELMQKYFMEKEQGYYLSPDIVKMVEFLYLNLHDNAFPSLLNGTNAQDLILCRNVLIYFNSIAIPLLMKKLNASLMDGGYLLLGASDPIDIKNTNLIPHPQEGLLFSKSEKKSISSKRTADALRHPILHKIEMKPVYKKAIELPSKKLPPPSLNEEAAKLADHGDLQRALTLCQESLTKDPTNKQTYFTLAMILIELNKLHEAEMALRKTLFLDHHFVMAHFQLGLLLLKNKQTPAGFKSLQNALTIATKKDPLQLVRGYQGLQYGRLAEILKNEIELHKINMGNDS